MNSTHPTSRRWQFSIGGMLIAIVVVACVLAQFYPRIHATVEINVSGSGPPMTATHCVLAKSDIVLNDAKLDDPRVQRMMGPDRVQWLKNNLQVRPTDPGRIELRIMGYPKDREQLTTIVDEVAAAYIRFFDDTQRATTQQALEDLKKAYADLATQVPPDQRLMNAIRNQVKSVEAELAKSPAPTKPQVIKREVKSGR